MSRRTKKRPHGQLRQSQLLTSFGPGAMVDLPDHAVLVGGLETWSALGDEILEPRLSEKLKGLFTPPLTSLKLFVPPPDRDEQQSGITAWQFPEWFITRDVSTDGPNPQTRARMLVHRKMLVGGKFVDVRRLDVPGTVATQIAIPQVVNHDVNDVRFLGALSKSPK